VDAAWLAAAFEEIDARWGSFERYVSEGLELTTAEVARLRNNLLE
jgi:protein-tyrosine phosphatase